MNSDDRFQMRHAAIIETSTDLQGHRSKVCRILQFQPSIAGSRQKQPCLVKWGSEACPPPW